MIGACHIIEVTLPHSSYLIFHFKRPEALVDGVHYFITLVTASPSVEACDDDPVCAGEVRAPVQLETIVHLLTTGASVPTRDTQQPYVSAH